MKFDIIDNIVKNIKDEDSIIVNIVDNRFPKKDDIAPYKLVIYTAELETKKFVRSEYNLEDLNRIFKELESLEFIDLLSSIILYADLEKYSVDIPDFKNNNRIVYRDVKRDQSNSGKLKDFSDSMNGEYIGILVKRKNISLKNLKNKIEVHIDVPLSPFIDGSDIGYVKKQKLYSNKYFMKYIITHDIKGIIDAEILQTKLLEEEKLNNTEILMMIFNKNLRKMSSAGVTTDGKSYQYKKIRTSKMFAALEQPEFFVGTAVYENLNFLDTVEFYINTKFLLQEFTLYDEGKFIKCNREITGITGDFLSGTSITSDDLDMICKKAELYNDPEKINAWKLLGLLNTDE